MTMNKVLEVIKQYDANKISLSDLQDYIWGLSENSFDGLSDEQIHHYLSLVC